MKLNKWIFVNILAIFFSTSVLAIEFEPPVLLARSNVKDSFNLPPMTYLNNIAPVINNQGDISFKVVATGEKGVQGLWIKASYDELGKVIFEAPEELVVTDPSLNDKGKIVFSLFDDVSTEGVYSLDIHDLKLNQVIENDQKDLTYFTYPTVDNNNLIYFRGTNKTNDRAFYSFDKSLKNLLSEGSIIAGQTASYLFKPSINQSEQIAFKMRIGNKGEWDENRPDAIVFYDSKNILDPKNNEHSKIIAVDRELDSKSPFLSFLNTVSLSNLGHIAFCGVIEDHRIGVFVYSPNGELKRIALENEGDLLNVETFSVKVNSLGHVLFRGKDKELKRSLFFYDGEKLTKLYRESSEIESDKGLAKILDNQYYPGFSGEVTLNDNDQIVFGAVLVSAKENHEWGTGIYLLNPKK